MVLGVKWVLSEAQTRDPEVEQAQYSRGKQDTT